MDTDAQSHESFRTVSALPPAELAAFLAVAQYGGFRIAGRKSGLSSSALSHAVASLETRLTVQLFRRTTRSVSLTEAGQVFFERLAPAMTEIAKAINELGDYALRPSGLLRINADATAAEQVLEPLILDFMKAYPDIRVEIASERRLVDIAEDGFDCGIRTAALVPSEMVAVPIGPMQQHIVVGSPNYLAGAGALKSPADLGRHQCIQLRMPSGLPYRWEFQAKGESINVDTRGSLILDNSRLITAAAVAGFGLGYITRWMAGPALAAGTLQEVLTDWTPAYPGLCLYYPKHRHMSVGMRAFLAFARSLSSDGRATQEP
jgi:DNA-binding transcriptional LysR family regulator